MNDVLKSIDWTQVGPFTTIALLGFLVVAPLFFKWVFKREDHGAEAQKRREDREQRIDQFLFSSIDQASKSLGQMAEIIDKVGDRVCDKISVESKSVHEAIGKLRDEIRDERSQKIQDELTAMRERQASHPGLEPAPSTRRP